MTDTTTDAEAPRKVNPSNKRAAQHLSVVLRTLLERAGFDPTETARLADHLDAADATLNDLTGASIHDDATGGDNKADA